MKIAICFLLVIWGIGLAQKYTYEYGQLTEDARNELERGIIIWETTTGKVTSTFDDPIKLLTPFGSPKNANINKAYGELLKKMGAEDDPDVANNRLEFLDYLGSLGWELMFFQQLSEQATTYQFKKLTINW